jgi:hypothetical protein
MKKLLTSLTVLLLLWVTAAAENPDSRPSIYFGVDGGFGNMEYEVLGISQDGDREGFGLGISVKWPVSENVTLGFGGAFDTGNSEYKMNQIFLPSKTDYNSFIFAFGIRIYLGPSINK